MSDIERIDLPERKSYDPLIYEAKKEKRIRPETRLAIKGLYTAMIRLQNSNTVKFTGHIESLIKNKLMNRHMIGFTLLDEEDLEEGPSIEVRSRKGLWLPRQLITVNGSIITEGFFVDSPEEELQSIIKSTSLETSGRTTLI